MRIVDHPTLAGRAHDSPVLLIGVTVSMSWVHHAGFPEYAGSRGYDVHVVSGPGPELTRLEATCGVTAHLLAMRREPSPLYDAIGLLKWICLMIRVRPQITVVGTPKAGLLGGLAAWLTRRPRRIYVLHGLRAEGATGLRRRLLLALERVAMRTAHTVVAVSPSLREQVVALGLVDPEKCEIVGRGSVNGVVVESRQDDNVAGLPRQSRNVVGFVGRLTREKGLAELLAAMDLLWSSMPETELLVVGPLESDQDELLSELERRQAVGLVRWVGRVDDVGPFYDQMNVLCLPSHREGLGMVVLEAAARGVPSVVTDVPGLRDTVVHGVTGLMVPRDQTDGAALAEALSGVLRDEPARRAMAIAARTHVVAHYERQDVQRKFLTRIMASNV